jgi:hypothetical protein
LRYSAATILHELGQERETIAAVTGHETVAMARKYTEKRRRARLAISRLQTVTAMRISATKNPAFLLGFWWAL